MALAVLPSYAKIKELRLCIPAPSEAFERPANLQVLTGTPYTEAWTGDIVFADMLRDSAKAFSAWMASLDGRVTAFRMALTAGKFSRAYSGTSALAAAPALGADRIQLDLTGTLYRGTRITVGNIESGPFQLFDVLETVSPNEGAVVRVAPRVRVEFAGSETVVCGTVNGKFRLRGDDLAVSVRLDRGVASLAIEEALD